MKTFNIKTITATVSALLILGSCSDLDVNIKSQYNELPTTQQATDAISGIIYTRTVGVGEGWFVLNNICSDVAVCVSMDGNWYDGGIYVRETLHQWTQEGDAGHLKGIWDDAFAGIVSCNSVLIQLSEDNRNGKLGAPARCMRAYFYYFLTDNFGAVPLMEKFGDVPEARTSRSEVIKFCEKELLAVRDMLPNEVNSTTYGKATRYVADALLAKIYLNWQVYMNDDVTLYDPAQVNPKLNDCIAVCDDIIKSNQFNLTDSYKNKFMPDNGSHIKDFIFAVPFDHKLFGGNKVMRYWSYRNGHEQFSAVLGWMYPSNPGGLMRMNPEYADKFCLEGDERNQVILRGEQNLYCIDGYVTNLPFIKSTTKIDEDELYTGPDPDAKVEHRVNFTRDIYIRDGLSNGVAQLNVGNDLIGREMGYRSIKFFPDKNMTASDSHNQSQDAPVFRYADILLMKAEAILRGGITTNGDTPESLMNQIRSYVNAPQVTTNISLDDILDERAREFLDEPWRRNDLIRFGQFESPTTFRSLYAQKELMEKFRRIYPIAKNTLETNASWGQNPGY